MDLSSVLRQLTPDISRSAAGIAPELLLVATIVLLLLWRVVGRSATSGVTGVALVGTLLAMLLAVGQLLNLVGRATLAESSFQDPVSRLVIGPLTDLVSTASAGATVEHPKDLFSGAVVSVEPKKNASPSTAPQPAAETKKPIQAPQLNVPRGMLRFDGFTVFFRIFLLLFAGLVIWLTALTGIPDREDSADFYVLLLGATLGMSLMASANHLLMVYIAVEMASLPSYALAGFLKGRRDASEASLKYVVYGAGASGVMLYGISLLAGKYGTAHLPSLALAIAGAKGEPVGGIMLLGVLLVLAGMAFKISAVPFHFWCPDVFEGAAAEVAGFLSVASKAGALALLARFAITLTATSDVLHSVSRPQLDMYVGATIAFLSAITATYGNLAAYAQKNLKRLLAFSTIAHAGYMMMPVAAAIILARGTSSTAQSAALQSLVFYLIVYLFMNLGAFAVIALIRNEIRSEHLDSYRGLIRRCPFLTIAMAVFLLSLTGIPPLAGFAAKWNIIVVLYDAKLYWLLVVLLANTVFSAFYYMNVLRVMTIEPCDSGASTWVLSGRVVLYCSILVAANFAFMLAPKAWDAMDGLTKLAVESLL
jgi:NADH-quinone oxidoreductase subunit N